MKIAIDGPGGSGKSTVSKLLAKKLNFTYIDTGAMYRAYALYAQENEIKLSDEERLLKLSEQTNIFFKKTLNNQEEIYINEKNYSKLIRTNEIGLLASEIAKYPKLRERFVEIQRKMAKENSVVMEGRDIGSVVFPDADVKFYLDASLKCRALRRWKESKESSNEEFEKIQKEINQRDFRDKNREFAPLIKVKDAFYIDTSDLDIEEVVKKMHLLILEKVGHIT